MKLIQDGSHHPAANENDDPLATVSSALNWVYFWKGKLLEENIQAMSFQKRREWEDAFGDLTTVERELLARL